MEYVLVFPYDEATGLILGRITTAAAEAGIQRQPNVVVPLAEAQSELPNDTTHYINQGVIMPRPEMGITASKTAIAADGVDEAVISGIPVGTVLTIPGQAPVTVDDGEVSFTSSVAGTFALSFVLVPYLDTVVEIIAT